MKHKTLRILTTAMLCVLMLGAFSMTAFASGNVAGAVEQTWTAAQSQVKQIVNNVVFPVPLAPASRMHSPWSISKEMSRTNR